MSLIPAATATRLLLQNTATPLRVLLMRVSPWLWFRIFISYRRDDTCAHAGRIYDRLIDTFGQGQVFKPDALVCRGKEAN